MAFRTHKDLARADLLPVPVKLAVQFTDRRTGQHMKSKDVFNELQ
jgi:hypothetical protein